MPFGFPIATGTNLMATANSIAVAIRTVVEQVGVAYEGWRIGITHDPQHRQREWQSKGHATGGWRLWQADTLSDAEAVEAHFIRAGMNGGTGGGCSPFRPVFVYIF